MHMRALLPAQDTGYGYGLNVADMLAGPYPQFYSKGLAGGLATVQHAGGFGANGGSSVNGLACMDHWLGGLAWDVVRPPLVAGLLQQGPRIRAGASRWAAAGQNHRSTAVVLAPAAAAAAGGRRRRAKRVPSLPPPSRRYR